MKEIIRQSLTGRSPSHTLRGGDIFMEGEPDMPPTNSQPSNPGHIEKPVSAVHSPVENTQNKQIADGEELRREWHASFTPEELKNADLRSTIEAAIKIGHGPQKITSKGPIDFKIIEVISNSLLDDKGRIKKAEDLLGQSLSPEQQEAILKAHYSSKDKIGKDGRGAGVYNLRREQLAGEVRILKNEGKFTDEQRRILLESGLAALNPVNLTGVTDMMLKQIGQRVNARLADSMMDYREVEKNIQDLESVLQRLPPGSQDELWARSLYAELYNEAVRQRQLSGEVNWEAVKDKLLIATRTGDLKTIEDIVRNSYDFNERINVRDLVEVSLSDDAIAGNTYGYALEYVMETIINVADLNPLGHIPSPTFTQSENISKLIKATLDLDQDEHKEFYKYISELQERRQLSHELYKSMSTRGAYQKYVGEHLKNDGFHYLENEIAGVSETQGLWEKVLARKVGKERETLSQKEFDDAHDEVKRLFKKNANLNADGTSQKLKKEFKIHRHGQQPVDIQRPLREWEIDRAATVGRSIAHVSGRAITYGTLGDLPALGDELFDSMNAEYVARIVASKKVMAQRFISLGFTASKIYMEKWVKNKKQIATEKGQIYGEGERTLYGQKQESWIYMDSSVPDLKTHSWRNMRTQLKNRRFGKIEVSDPNDPEKNTIGDYLDRKWKEVEDKVKKVGLDHLLDPIRGSLTPEELAYLDSQEAIKVSKSDRIKNLMFCRSIKDIMLKQRLYLGTILRQGHLTPMLREEIWKKASEFLPSRIAAFFPDERKALTQSNGTQMRENHIVDEWRDLSDKLFMAEMDRTREQQKRIRRNDFSEVNLSDFYDSNGITPDEIIYINKIIVVLGKNKSKMLSNMIFPQSAFLDDAPEPDWMNLGKETVGRLLVNDYEGFDTANNEVGATIGNPAMRLGQSAEHLVKAKDGYASPLGLEDAQDRLEADVMTRYDMYGMDTSSKWGLYAVNRWRRKPTSLIEESNVDANISMDEKAIFDDVNFLSQNNVVGNDRARLDFLGHTQSERIKRKAKARLRDVFLRNLRLFAMIFPEAFSIEFLKMIAPDFVQGK